MDITEIDKNFKLEIPNEPDLVWYNAKNELFSLHGIYYDEEEKSYRLMPEREAEKISFGVNYQARYTSGGRLRFITDSPYVAIKCVEPTFEPPHISSPSICTHGFDLYREKESLGYYCADYQTFKNIPNYESEIAFSGIIRINKSEKAEYTLHFPRTIGVNELYIGLKEGSILEAASKYRNGRVIYYGSSITQCSCSSGAGKGYQEFLSRWLECDYVNYGFSGNCLGELEMARFLGKQDASVYVIDYDHNAPNAEYLEKTHYPFYKELRKYKPNTSVLFMTMPNFDTFPEAERRAEIIKTTYKEAKKAGDKNVWFINGRVFLGKRDRSSCTLEGLHPNVLGYYRMARALYPVLKKILKKK